MALPNKMLILVLEFGFRVWDIQKNGLPDSLFFVRCKGKRGKKLVLERGVLFKRKGRALEESFFLSSRSPCRAPELAGSSLFPATLAS